MQYSVESAYEWLYPDTAVSHRKALPPLLAARNGTAAFQLLLTDAPAGLLTARVTSDLRWDLFLELPVYCPRNTGSAGFTLEEKGETWQQARQWCTRQAPFYVFDALRALPEAGLTAEPGTLALYCSVTVPAETTPGLYPLRFDLRIGPETLCLSGLLEVTSARVEAETLRITDWFSVTNMAAHHHLEPFGEAHWEMIRQYGLLMRRGRQNVFWVDQSLLQVSRDEKGVPHFDFSRTARLISLYFSLGFTCIEAAPLLYRKTWADTEFLISSPEGPLSALGEEGYTYIAAYFSAWYAFLKEHHWLDRVIQHVGDEPHRQCADAYRILSGIVRKFMPGVPLVEAVELPELAGAVDIWVPKGNSYEENRAAYEARRAQRDEIWHYSCCIPGGTFANRLLDLPLNRCRMLQWANYVYGMTGFLHWGLNQLMGEDPFRDTVPSAGKENHFLPAGDSHCVYPLPGTCEVCGSMRLEQQKGGAEEYELLKQLSAKDAAAADAVAACCFRRFDDCDNSAAAFEAARERLLRAL